MSLLLLSIVLFTAVWWLTVVSTSKLPIKLSIYDMYKNEIAPSTLLTISRRSISSTMPILPQWKKNNLRIWYQEALINLWLTQTMGEKKKNVRSRVSKKIKKKIILDAGVNEIKMKWLCSGVVLLSSSERRTHHSSHPNWRNRQQCSTRLSIISFIPVFPAAYAGWAADAPLQSLTATLNTSAN